MALGDEPKIPEFGSGKPEQSEFKLQLREVLSFIRSITVLIIIAIFLRGTIVEAFKIPSGSMIPTLRIGDHILVSKFAYGFRLPFIAKTLLQYDTPRRGDVVVFTLPDDPNTLEKEDGINIIKRVIGLPGDVVEVRGTSVYVNNEKLDEGYYVQWEENGIKAGYFGPERVPEGHVLLLGDNRDHSRDSRFWPDPFLEIERIKGKAFLVYWSWDQLGRIGEVIR